MCEIPEPGKPVVWRTPCLLKLSVNPFLPTLKLIPPLLRFAWTPEKTVNVFRKRTGINSVLPHYGVTVTVKASGTTAVVLFGFVTRTSQACVPKEVSTAVLTVITIVVGLTTCAGAVTCGAVPCPPSKLTTAPLTKFAPVMVTFTLVFAGAVFGVTL